MPIIWGLLCGLFSVATAIALYHAVRSARLGNWKNVALLILAAMLFAGQASVYFGGAQGKEMSGEDPSVPRFR